MSNAISGFGTLLKIGDGATPIENFTTIAEVGNISGPALRLETQDVTNHSSPDGWREYVATLLDAGEVTFDLNFIPTDATQGYATGLLKDMTNRVKRNFQLVFPNVGNTTWSFSAYVTGYNTSEPIDDALSASVTLRITGKPALA